jgi:hypothetical protein
MSRRNDPGLVECELFKALLPHEREEVMQALYPHDCQAGFDGDDLRTYTWICIHIGARDVVLRVSMRCQFSFEPPHPPFKCVVFTS